MALANRLLAISRSSRLFYPATAQWYSGDGSAGAIREAGGAFGKKEKAVEDQYFRQQEKEKLEKLKELAQEHHEEEIRHHEDSIEELKEQIERHQEKIKRHKKKMEDHHD